MMPVIWVALGGACGALLRWQLILLSARYVSLYAGFPLPTLLVNALGSFLIALVYLALQQRLMNPDFLRYAIIVGLLGSFTTFSTFSLETLQLIEAGEFIKALLNALLSVTVCLAAAFVGWRLAKFWFVA